MLYASVESKTKCNPSLYGNLIRSPRRHQRAPPNPNVPCAALKSNKRVLQAESECVELISVSCQVWTDVARCRPGSVRRPTPERNVGLSKCFCCLEFCRHRHGFTPSPLRGYVRLKQDLQLQQNRGDSVITKVRALYAYAT